MRPKPYRDSRQTRHWNTAAKAVVWVVLTIFVLTSVGVALVAVR